MGEHAELSSLATSPLTACCKIAQEKIACRKQIRRSRMQYTAIQQDRKQPVCPGHTPKKPSCVCILNFSNSLVVPNNGCLPPCRLFSFLRVAGKTVESFRNPVNFSDLFNTPGLQDTGSLSRRLDSTYQLDDVLDRVSGACGEKMESATQLQSQRPPAGPPPGSAAGSQRPMLGEPPSGPPGQPPRSE